MQTGFDFSAPLMDVTTTSPTGEPLPPVQTKATGAALHCSTMGALKAREFAEAQREKVLTAYRTHGPLTDAEVHAITGIERSSICARRDELIKLDLVEKDGGRTKKNPHTGVSNTLWRAR